MLKKGLLLIIILLFSESLVFCLSVDYQPLVSKNEKALISFKLADSEKIVTVSISTNKPEYILYRFGQKNQIELEYPKETAKSWDKFEYSYYFRGGGPGNSGIDLNYLAFTNEGYTYTIYEEYYLEDETSRVGIKVKNNQTNKEVDLKGDFLSLKGSLIELRFEKRIAVNEMS